MSRTDREDAVAKALDLLPTDDAANSDPRLLRHPDLMEEVSATREVSANVWLAISPLRAAPPDVLHSVMAKIEAQAPLAERRRNFFPWLAASGWAAAAVAMILWPRNTESGIQTVVVTEKAPALPVRESASPELPPPVQRLKDEERQLRRELGKLRSNLERIQENELVTAPRVMALSSPGAVARTPEEMRQRMVSVLADAMRSDLEAESGAPNDPAAIVIERGWLPEGFTAPDDGSAIRHMNFPENSWPELGLLKADDGSYYDPSRELVWTEDAGGRGFVGRKATGGEDLAAYRQADEAAVVAKGEPRTEPEGFVIEDPVANLAEVVIDQVPPPEEGSEQVVVWKDAAGTECTVKVASSEGAVRVAPTSADGVTPMLIPTLSSASASGVFANTIVLTIPGSGGLQSFQLIEVPIKPNGKPHKVIVAGGKSGQRAKMAMRSRGG